MTDAALSLFHIASRWDPPCTPFSSTNKTDSRDIAEILLKVVLNIIIRLLLHINQRLYHVFWVETLTIPIKIPKACLENKDSQLHSWKVYIISCDSDSL